MQRDRAQSVWDDADLSSVYARQGGLFVSELAVLAEAWPLVRGGRVLDIGVGGGRTLPYLSGVAGRYVAVDFSQAMVDACRERFHGVDVRQGDARDLEGHADESYDFVMFSYNGIDCVPPGDRPKVLAAVRRVLRPGGAFAFSIHSARRAPPVPSRFALPEVPLSANPVRMAGRLARAARDTAVGFANHRRLRGEEHRGDGYVFVNDGAHNWAMLFVYADPSWQQAELERAGFSNVRVFDEKGRETAAASVADAWPQFLATRA